MGPVGDQALRRRHRFQTWQRHGDVGDAARHQRRGNRLAETIGKIMDLLRASVVIADHQVNRHRKARQDPRRFPIGERIAIMGQVSTHDAESCIAVFAGDL
jgi:hypothetical protein